MCGIIGIIAKEAVAEGLLEGLQRLAKSVTVE
jgi:glucosamine 6-phosphate synthetase-like amidotransferase/phosphosugar isomerase protein